MNRRILIALGAVALAAGPLAVSAAPNTDPAALPAGTYVLDKTHASVTGQVSHFGFSAYTFRFDTIDATFTYDPKAPEASKLQVTIDANSLNTGFQKADDAFPNEFLAADKAPKITFVSSAIKRTGSKGTVTGDLTLGGVTKPVTLDVTYNGFGATMGPANRAGFSATGVVKRSEFGLTKYAPAIGDDVKLAIEVEFTKQ
jgi:polyisoprenoid-binding protein YceI